MKPWLWIPAKLAHALAPVGLQLMGFFREVNIPIWRPLTWRGLEFKNRLGLAGGIDKNGEEIEDWWKFGPGFLEIGTVTPKPQGPNDGKIFDRDVEAKALWNRMGFPGKGAWDVRENLRDLESPRPTPIFVNIGKNRATPNERAADDYAECIRILAGLADAFVINISSPNTTGLRDLFKPENFGPFLKAIFGARELYAPRTPLLLKLSPDLDESDLTLVVEQSLALGIDGWIATNTTLVREPGSKFPAEGGVSGAPLARHAKEALARLLKIVGNRRQDRLIVAVGGVMTPQDVAARLVAGADLVQVYSALVFEGPGLFARTYRELAE
jgi:dihydroorotate dehydrogenase